MKNRSKSISGETVNWLAIKWMRFDKRKPYFIQYKNLVTSEDLDEIFVLDDYLEQLLTMPDWHNLYRTRLPISEAKKKDLMDLLRAGVIPSQYRTFYSELPSDTAVRDCLAEPSADEVESDKQDPTSDVNIMSGNEELHLSNNLVTMETVERLGFPISSEYPTSEITANPQHRSFLSKAPARKKNVKRCHTASSSRDTTVDSTVKRLRDPGSSKDQARKPNDKRNHCSSSSVDPPTDRINKRLTVPGTSKATARKRSTKHNKASSSSGDLAASRCKYLE